MVEQAITHTHTHTHTSCTNNVNSIDITYKQSKCVVCSSEQRIMVNKTESAIFLKTPFCFFKFQFYFNFIKTSQMLCGHFKILCHTSVALILWGTTDSVEYWEPLEAWPRGRIRCCTSICFLKSGQIKEDCNYCLLILLSAPKGFSFLRNFYISFNVVVIISRPSLFY